MRQPACAALFVPLPSCAQRWRRCAPGSASPPASTALVAPPPPPQPAQLRALAALCVLPTPRTLRVGYLASSCAWRRSAAEPMTAPSGSSARLLYLVEMKTSRTSSRGRLQGSTVPAGR